MKSDLASLPGHFWVALETSGNGASVALGRPGKPEAGETITGNRRHAIELVPVLERVMAAAGARLDHVAGIVISDGPGSFTGLRIGATVAKALARVIGCPVHAASALSLIARGAWLVHPVPGQRILAVTDALRGDVYAGVFRMDEKLIATEVPGGVFTLASLQELAAADRVVTTMDLPPGLPLDRAGGEPQASVLLEMLNVEGGTELIEDLETWEPEYGRPAEAQAKWEAMHGRHLPDSPGTSR